MRDSYEIVIGLEVHVELKTKTKIFCSCPTDFGGEPNSRCCPVCMGLPGALPVLNRQAMIYAARAGLALGCHVSTRSGQDRKNYFYPDLPKAYQISQFDRPLCRDGSLCIDCDGEKKTVGITRIHMEEDAGKLIHDEKRGTMIDYNRCGIPLIEIVSEPDLRSSREARAYLQKLRSVILYTGVSDCRMNEGSFRADVNLSVRKRGETSFGVRTEIKNLNSFAFVAKAIDYEAERQIALLEAGEPVLRETRRFDPATGKTFGMRVKESAEDYRFFPDPDLPDVRLSEEEIAAIADGLPELPDAKSLRFAKEYGLSEYDGGVLSADRALAEYFDAAARQTAYPKVLANLIMNELLGLCEEESFRSPIAVEHMASLSRLLGEGRINGATAKKLLRSMWERDEDPVRLAEEGNLWQIHDGEILRSLLASAILANPRLAEDYRRGKKHAAKALIGQVMAQTGGRANPAMLTELAEKALSEEEK